MLRLRLRRLGAALKLELEGPPPLLRGWVHVDIAGRPGDLTLRIGRDVKIGRDCVVDLLDGCAGTIALGDRATLSDRVRLQPWDGTIAIGADVAVRDEITFKSRGELSVGERVLLGRGCALHCHEQITVGADCALGERVTITDSDHTFDGSDTGFVRVAPVRSAPVALEANTLVGHGAVVLKGARIGANSAVAAGAVVVGGEYKGAHLISGAPAKVVRPLSGG